MQFDEVEKAILRLKDNKAAGPDNIPPEVIKHGGCALHRRLHNFILDCWSAKCLPQRWNNANIILVYKQKGDRAECGNSRGISILSVAGKVLAKIMLTCLLEHVVDLVLPESQCGFGVDAAQLIWYLLLGNCKKNVVNNIKTYTWPSLIWQRHLIQSTETFSGTFCVNLAVLPLSLPYYNNFIPVCVLKLSWLDLSPPAFLLKQGCILTLIIFNLLLVAITLVSHRDMQSSDCVGIEYRLDGGLFNLRRLQAKTKTSSAMISALQYADDAAIPSDTADGLQRSLDVMSETYLRAGLIINTTKTEILRTPSPDAPTYSIRGNQLKNSENFTYLGSNLSFSGDLTNKIQRRINLASSYHLIWLIVHNTSLYVIIALILLLYTQVFLRVQFLALCFSPCILSLCLPLLTHTLSYIIHLLMTYNYRCLLPQIEYLSYFTLCSHV